VLSDDDRAAALHRAAIIVDAHDDVTTPMVDRGFDLARPDGKTMTDIPRMHAGGITAEIFSIFVDAKYKAHPSQRAFDMIDATLHQVDAHPDDLLFAVTTDDIRRAKREGKIAIMMGIEGGSAIEGSLALLRTYRRLGVRYMTLVHTESNDLADSAGLHGPAAVLHHGLSPRGEEVVHEMQRIGMLVDVSHASDETIAGVLRVSRAPVIASHSASRAIAPHRRNIPDDLARGVAATGGIVMVNFFPAFIDPEYGRRDGGGTPLSVLADHIVHLVDVAGEDHVGLGSDFDGVPSMPIGLEGIDGLPALTRELVRRGLSDAAIRKVLGENFLRVLDAADAAARTNGDVNTGGLPPSNGTP
jgi:membrane dipeptidase